MASNGPNKGIRKSPTPRARSGCLTCNRVKCDERKSSCGQCISTGRICEGYSSVQSLGVTLSTDSHLSEQERRAFHYFRARTTKRIFGQQDGVDWAAPFVQLGYAEAVIRHAIVALASQHECLENGNHFALFRGDPSLISNAARMRALKHHHEAISLLRTEPLKMSSQPDITLISCILFLCFEQLQRNDNACLVHLTAGLNLVQWWKGQTSTYTGLNKYSRPTADLVNGTLTSILQRLRVQFCLCMDQRHIQNMEQPPSLLPIPTTLSSYDTPVTARADYDRIMGHVFSMSSSSPPTQTSAPSYAALDTLRQWYQAVVASKFHTQDPSTESWIFDLLSLYYHTSIIITRTLGASTETIFDNFIPHFRSAVSSASSLLQNWKPSSHQHSLLYSFDLGITPPMFFVASRCRDPKIRRKAVDLMMRASEYRGAWQDRYTGLCAQRMIEIEELGLYDALGTEYVPECQRIRKISADADEQGREVVMQYVRSPFLPDSPVLSTSIPLQA